MNKPVIIFTTADQNNFPYAVLMLNSLTKFHKATDIDIVLYTNEKRPEELAKLPKGVKIEDITPYLKDDQMFFYRQKPILGEKYIDEYDLVLGLDCDQIILGSLDYIFKTNDYDVGVVVNWNRKDPQMYGFVEINRLGIQPPEYYNCGLVAMRSKKFVHHWKVLCFAPEFNFCQYKEQDMLNILAHFGNYNVRNFDAMDKMAGMQSWWGLISKGEWMRTEVKNGKIIIPKGFGDTPFPPVEVDLRVIHFGGGNTPNKMNFRVSFPEPVIKRIEELIAPNEK